MRQDVILVDEKDRQIGTEEKLAAHSNGGRLHRAISVFVFNNKGETLLQQRSDKKYHSEGLWANTCCSHPFVGEDALTAGHRRLKEEMGFDCDMHEAFQFKYEAGVSNGLTEKEYDHILFGHYDGSPEPNPDEVKGWRWVKISELERDIKVHPEEYAAWLRLIIKDLKRAIAAEQGKR